MAAYTADPGEVGIYGRTLTAGQEDVVTLAGTADTIEIRYWPNSGTEPMYVRFGEAAAAAPASDGGSPAVEMFPGEHIVIDDPASTKVRLWSAGTAKYSVAEA